jgi:hypothetical protein
MGMTEHDILAQVEKGLGEANRQLDEIAEQLRQLTAAVRSVAPARPAHTAAAWHPEVDSTPRPQF